MKVLVIGAPGQLGNDVCRAFADEEVITADLEGAQHVIDISNLETTRQIITETITPDLVVNTAAAHNVAACEEKPEQAYAVNATGARNLGIACNQAGARLVHISTDYVFGHGHSQPLVESDSVSPLSTYGASKVAGEFLLAAECPNHIIVRTAAIYGEAPCLAKGGKNFVQLMLHLAETKGKVRVVTDEITTPTYTKALAQQIRKVAEEGEPGLYHITCQGACSWYDFAKAIFDLTQTDVTLDTATNADFPSPIKRPSYSVLENKQLKDQGLDIMPDWEEGLKAYLRAIGLYA